MPGVTSSVSEQVTVMLSATALAVVAGLVAPTTEINHDGILADGEIWAELEHAFPLEVFWEFVVTDPESYDADFGT